MDSGTDENILFQGTGCYDWRLCVYKRKKSARSGSYLNPTDLPKTNWNQSISTANSAAQQALGNISSPRFLNQAVTSMPLDIAAALRKREYDILYMVTRSIGKNKLGDDIVGGNWLRITQQNQIHLVDFIRFRNAVS
jgi:hypothetical protein